jgi:hypothetical protein
MLASRVLYDRCEAKLDSFKSGLAACQWPGIEFPVKVGLELWGWLSGLWRQLK